MRASSLGHLFRLRLNKRIPRRRFRDVLGADVACNLRHLILRNLQEQRHICTISNEWRIGSGRANNRLRSTLLCLILTDKPTGCA